MLHALLTGLVLGAAAGLIPGPLQALVISQSAQQGWRSGLRVALAPLITDAVIVIATAWLFSHVPGQVLQGMTVLGAVMVGYIGRDAWRAAQRAAKGAGSPVPPSADAGRALEPAKDVPPSLPPRNQGLWQAVAVNMVNPHAWLFWVVVGAPLLVRFGNSSIWYAAGFVFCFYLLLVGTKVVLAVGVDRGVAWTGAQGQVWILRITAAALAVLAIVMCVAGLRELL